MSDQVNHGSVRYNTPKAVWAHLPKYASYPIPTTDSFFKRLEDLFAPEALINTFINQAFHQMRMGEKGTMPQQATLHAVVEAGRNRMEFVMTKTLMAFVDLAVRDVMSKFQEELKSLAVARLVKEKGPPCALAIATVTKVYTDEFVPWYKVDLKSLFDLVHILRSPAASGALKSFGEALRSIFVNPKTLREYQTSDAGLSFYNVEAPTGPERRCFATVAPALCSAGLSQVAIKKFTRNMVKIWEQNEAESRARFAGIIDQCRSTDNKVNIRIMTAVHIGDDAALRREGLSGLDASDREAVWDEEMRYKADLIFSLDLEMAKIHLRESVRRFAH